MKAECWLDRQYRPQMNHLKMNGATADTRSTVWINATLIVRLAFNYKPLSGYW